MTRCNCCGAIEGKTRDLKESELERLGYECDESITVCDECDANELEYYDEDNGAGGDR